MKNEVVTLGNILMSSQKSLAHPHLEYHTQQLLLRKAIAEAGGVERQATRQAAASDDFHMKAD